MISYSVTTEPVKINFLAPHITSFSIQFTKWIMLSLQVNLKMMFPFQFLTSLMW